MACKYCGLPKFPIYAFTVRVNPEETDYIEEYIPVNYCPKCGKKLAEPCPQDATNPESADN